MKRRRLISVGVAALFSGCAASLTSENDGSTTNNVEDIVPPESEEWTEIEREEYTWSYLGGEDGLLLRFKHSSGEVHKFAIFEGRDQEDARQTARQFKCAGWPVAAYRERYAVAAGTGTDNVTVTPEHPPQFDETPIPGSAARSEALVLASSYFTKEYLMGNIESECDRNK